MLLNSELVSDIKTDGVTFTIAKGTSDILDVYIYDEDGNVVTPDSNSSLKLSVKLHVTRGSNNGVRISYGKNLTDLNADIDTQNTYTTIYAFAVDGNGQYHEVTSPVDISNGHLNTYGSNRCLILDLSDQFDNDETITEPDLISKAQSTAWGTVMRGDNIWH